MGILTWRGFGCDQEDSWSGVEQAIALWCCEIPKARKGYYRTIFGSGSLRLRISLHEMNDRIDLGEAVGDDSNDDTRRCGFEGLHAQYALDH